MVDEVHCTRYHTSDGKYFKTEQEAIEYEKKCNFKEFMTKLVQKHHCEIYDFNWYRTTSQITFSDLHKYRKEIIQYFIDNDTKEYKCHDTWYKRWLDKIK